MKFSRKGDGSQIKRCEDDHWADAARLFGIQEKELQELCCTKVIMTPGKGDSGRIVIEVNELDAKINRDT